MYIKMYKPDLLSNDINVVCSSIIDSIFCPQHLDVVFFGKDSSVDERTSVGMSAK